MAWNVDYRVVFGLACLGIAGCGEKETSEAEESAGVSLNVLAGTKLSSSKGAGEGLLFKVVPPEESGINPKYVSRKDHPLAYMEASGLEAGGVAVGDVDGDGRPDLFVASSPGNNRLYRQTGPLFFEDITEGSGLDQDSSWSRGASLVDLDNDGDLDLFVANYGAPNEVFLNSGVQDGRVKFVESAEKLGLALHDASLMPAFCDYDHDGDLDLYLMSNQYHWPKSQTKPSLAEMLGNKDGKPVIKHPYDKFFRVTEAKAAPEGGYSVKTDKCGRPNFLFRNEGGTFKNVTEEVGIDPGHGRGLSPMWWDYNDDGFMDLYVANDWGDRDFLYRNNGDGTFEDVIADVVPYTSMFTMGSDSGDLNNDGRIDYMAADMSGTTHYKRKVSMGAMQADQIDFMAAARPQQNMRNAVYLNTGSERLMEGAYLMGLANSDWSWAVKVADFDNDGWNDVFVTNGMEQNLREIEGETDGVSSKELRKEDNLAFRNLGDLKFKECGKEWGLNHFGYSMAAVRCDFDRDGDLDLFVIHRDELPTLYENRSTGNGLLVELRGSANNRFGIGAKVSVVTSRGTQAQRMMPARGFLGSNEAVLHFGLGEDEAVEKLIVEWPGGGRQEYQGLESGTLYQIVEEEADPGPEKSGSATKFVKLATKEVVHREVPFNDFASQPLLPNKLSQLGPGLAVGDIDGDGDDDYVLGGAKGSATQVVLNDGKGGMGAGAAIEGTGDYEDMGLVLFDVDADGDRDLFVASGGVESSGDLLADRLYLNDGKGNFQVAPDESLPGGEESGGPVAVADVDRDGDLDVFVGGRVVPGQYPLASRSRLLINEGGVFKEGELPGELGMVTGAVFSDVNGDGLQDLLLSREWGPIAYLRNDEGNLVDATDASGLAGVTGWWNGIATGDLDGDGDIDLVATNFGLNTKYHASVKKPAELYYGKFGTDKMRLVEAEYEGDELLPVRGKSCSTRAIPHLADKFKTYHDFALADMAQIYTKPVIEESMKFEANTLPSGVFLNDGTGKFVFEAFPRIAQIAPSFGIVVSELDGDGIPDIFLAQNFYSPQIETGRMSGGLGLLLKGRGDGSFEPVWPKESGISSPHDMTAAAMSDFNGDGLPELVVASNHGPVEIFEGRQGTGKVTRVVLEGDSGNPEAVGARVSVESNSGTVQTYEVQAGHGYLGQSGRGLFVGGEIKKINVRWPDGSESSFEGPGDQTTISLKKGS